VGLCYSFEVHVIRVRPLGLASYVELLRILSNALDQAVAFDLSNLTFVWPPLLAILCASVELRLRGDPARSIPSNPVMYREPRAHNVASYIKAMNIFEAPQGTSLSLGPLTDSQYLPLCPLGSTIGTDEIASQMKRILIDQVRPSHLTKSKYDALVTRTLYSTLAELLENFSSHAQSDSLGFVCAQYYPPRKRKNRSQTAAAIEIAIADTGIGIERSLAAVPELHVRIGAGENPCELATQLGVTSKPEHHAGIGLWLARRLLEINEGTLGLASGNHWLMSRRGTTRHGKLDFTWPGTFVGLRLTLQGELDVNTIYREQYPEDEALSTS
jgi:hypothetical protein